MGVQYGHGYPDINYKKGREDTIHTHTYLSHCHHHFSSIVAVIRDNEGILGLDALVTYRKIMTCPDQCLSFSNIQLVPTTRENKTKYC